MLTLLLASVLSLAPVQSGGLDRQLDDVLAAIDAGQGPSWELADRLRDLARARSRGGSKVSINTLLIEAVGRYLEQEGG